MQALGSVVDSKMSASLLGSSSALSLANRSALPRQRLARSNPDLLSFLAVLGGYLFSVMPCWPGSVLPCRCLSLCLRLMTLGQLTRQSRVSLRGRFWQG